MKEFKESIINKIIALKNSKGWSQSELARKIGVSSAAISLIEKGNQMPSMTTLREIANVFDIFIEELAGDITPSTEDEQKILFNKFGDLNKLSEDEQKIIMSLVKLLLIKKE